MFKLLAAALLLPLSALAADAPVGPGKEIRIAYTARVDNRIVDSASAADPVVFVYGVGAMMPGIEAALSGLRAGESRSFEVAPADAYGVPDPDAVRSVPLSLLAPGLKPEVGMEVEARAGPDEAMPAVVRSVAADRVVLDFNHPLAGKTLAFKVTVLAVNPAPRDLYPRARKAARKYPGLLKVTPDGTVFPAVDIKAAERTQVAGLLAQLKSDSETALLQCGMQVVGVETKGSMVKTYGVLNGATRKTLLGLVDPGSGTITEAEVTAALLAPYADPEIRNRKPLACPLLLAPLTKGLADPDRRMRQEVCPRVARLAACLEDLRATDRRLSEQAGPYGRRLYSGARWDSRVNYLDQFETAGR